MCSARVNLSCRQDICVISESTGSRSKLICSEMFVFCSGLLVSLSFGVSCQRSRLSEIRWLNVKQPTSTRSGSVSLTFETCHERDMCVLLEHLCPADKTFVSPASSTLSQSETHSRVHAARELHVTVSAQSKCLSVTVRPWLRVHSTHLSADSAHSHIACGMAAGFI